MAAMSNEDATALISDISRVQHFVGFKVQCYICKNKMCKLASTEQFSRDGSNERIRLTVKKPR